MDTFTMNYSQRVGGSGSMSDYSNSSIESMELEHAPTLTQHAIIKAIVLCVLGILSIVGNSATIYSILRNHRDYRGASAIYTLILHLSVADLFVSVFCIMGDAMWSYTVNWPWGNVACKFFKFSQMFSLYLSTFVLVLIGVDRFVAVRYPLTSFNYPGRCQQFVAIAWILAFILSIPQAIIFRVAKGPFIEEFTQCVTHGFYDKRWQEQLYTTLSLFFMFILPLLILMFTYAATVITIIHSEKLFKTEVMRNNNNDLNNYLAHDEPRRQLMKRARKKSLRISIVIIAAFLIWWIPYHVMMLIFMFLDPDKHLSEDLRDGIFFFGMSNSLVNPLIYGAFHLCPRQSRVVENRRDDSTMQRYTSAPHFTLMSAPGGEYTYVPLTAQQNNPEITAETNNLGNSQATDGAS